MAKDKTAEDKTADTKPTSGFTYTLLYPIDFEGEHITEIDYRRPKGRDVRAAFRVRNDGGEMYTSLLVAICEQPAGLFDALDATDYVALIDICDGFLSPPKTSKAGSTA